MRGEGRVPHTTSRSPNIKKAADQVASLYALLVFMRACAPRSLSAAGLVKELINAVKRLAVSTGQLKPLLVLHTRPIDLVVFQEPSHQRCGRPHLAEGFTLICLQRLSWPYVDYPAVPLARQQAHQRYVPPNPLVLGRKPRKSPAPTTDRDRPVSRRSKPSSRTAFIGEQPNPWELLHPQDAMSRHRTYESTISRGVDYVFILSSILGFIPNARVALSRCAHWGLDHDLTFADRSRRLAWTLPPASKLAG